MVRRARDRKTHALRAPAWECRRWCRFHYTTYPESFLDQSRYLLDVVLDTDGDGEDGARDREPHAQDRWRLLLLEDTGELLTPDAKERVGQGLSRLLNLADGLIVYQPCPWRFIEAYEAKASLLDGGLESAYSVNSITASGRRPPGRQWKHKRPHARLRVET
jgi:hypothetical protein